MNDKFLCGIILGMLGGAVIVANSAKVRKAVCDGQDQVMQKMTEISENAKKKMQKD